MGFEPTLGNPRPLFESGTMNHSVTSPSLVFGYSVIDIKLVQQITKGLINNRLIILAGISFVKMNNRVFL